MNESQSKKKRLEALSKANQAKQAQALQRSLLALDEMEKAKVPINFQSVAKAACVSKTLLYNTPELCEKIEKLRNKTALVRRSTDIHIQLQRREKEIQRLRHQNQQQTNTIKKLKVQLEIAYGELYKRGNDIN